MNTGCRNTSSTTWTPTKKASKTVLPCWTACGESFTAASTRRKSMMGPSRRSMRIISDKNFCGEADNMEQLDFTGCRRIFGKAYNGANGKKIAVEYEGDIYMLKFPPSAKNKPTALSYTNSCFSEHIASSIFRMLGIPGTGNDPWNLPGIRQDESCVRL